MVVITILHSYMKISKKLQIRKEHWVKLLTILLADWQVGLITAVIIITVIALLCIIMRELSHYHQRYKKAKRSDYINNIIHGGKTDEQVIRAMAAPIGPKVDVGLIFAVASSSRMTPRLKAWIMKHYPSALASAENITDDEIIKLSELDNSDVDYRLLHRDKPLPVPALKNIADTVDPIILYIFRHNTELMRNKEVASIVKNSVKNTIGF